MFIVESYAVAIIMCFITMICWGSWANTTKLVSNKNGSSLYSIGIIQLDYCCVLCYLPSRWVLWAKPVAALYLIFSRRAAVV